MGGVWGPFLNGISGLTKDNNTCSGSWGVLERWKRYFVFLENRINSEPVFYISQNSVYFSTVHLDSNKYRQANLREN